MVTDLGEAGLVFDVVIRLEPGDKMRGCGAGGCTAAKSMANGTRRGHLAEAK